MNENIDIQLRELENVVLILCTRVMMLYVGKSKHVFHTVEQNIAFVYIELYKNFLDFFTKKNFIDENY